MTTSNYLDVALRLSVLESRFAVCKLGPDDEVPNWTVHGEFSSITRTRNELSIVCPEQNIPEGVSFEGGWRAIGIEGPLDFSLIGVLASLLDPLAEARIGVFAVSTYDTDYVLVKEDLLEPAATALRRAGHEVRTTEAVGENTFAIRPVTVEDEPFLWEMLAEAAQEPEARNVVENPGTTRYVEGWGDEGDLGFVAVSKDIRIGAAWLRLLAKENKGYGYVDDETPELAIAVHPDFRGTGVGKRLLAELLEEAKGLYRTVCLSVRPENPAFYLYEKMGFEVVPDNERTNRTSGSSFTMKRNLY